MIKFKSLSEGRQCKSKENKQLRIQALLVIMTNTTCWLPSSVILILSVIAKNYPLHLLTWNAVLINPINSLINPIIFCVLPLVKQIMKRKLF